jgi:hypothetical protein
MSEPLSQRKRGLVSVVMVVAAAVLLISPSYIVGYLFSRGRLSISVGALVALAMFLVGGFLIIRLLKE